MRLRRIVRVGGWKSMAVHETLLSMGYRPPLTNAKIRKISKKARTALNKAIHEGS